MKKIIGITAIIIGILLMVVPRYVLPACEFEGFPRMHCSDTARAEFVCGSLSVAIGIATLFLRSIKLTMAGGLAALVLFLAALALPDKFGYCHSTRMPCNYGMVPGIRFIAAAGVIITTAALVAMVRSLRKKEAP